MKAVLDCPAEVTIHGGRRQVKNWRDRLALKVPNAERTDAFARGWDGYKRPGRHRWNKNQFDIYRGLLPRFLHDFPDTEVVRQHDPPPQPDFQKAKEELEVQKLRDYQVASIKRIFKHKWGRVALATNAGKGAVMGVVCRIAADAGMNAAVFADQVSVFEALVEEIEKWGKIEPELVESGRENPPTCSVVVAMIPTVYNRLEDRPDWQDWFASIDMALLDEADRISSTSKRWQKCLEPQRNNHYRIGFSGSFDTHDNLDLMEQESKMGPILIQAKNKELIERGISAKPQVVLYEYRQEWKPLPDAPSWFRLSGTERHQWTYEELVLFNDDRHAFIRDLVDKDRQNVIVVERVRHGEVLADEWLDDAVFLYGDDSREERREVLDRFMNDEFRTLVATRILDRGTNLLGHARTLIFASGTGSETQTLQRIGRGLRKTERKHRLTLKDVVDVRPPWHPADKKVDPYEYFENAEHKRVEVYEDEGFDVERIGFNEERGGTG